MEDADLGRGRGHRPRGGARPARPGTAEGRRRRHSLRQPRGVGPGGFRDLLRRRPDDPDLPDLSRGPGPLHRGRRRDQNARRRGSGAARQGHGAPGRDARARAARGAAGLRGPGSRRHHLGRTQKARPGERGPPRRGAGHAHPRETPRRHRHDRLHLRHNRPAQGGRPDPWQPHGHAEVVGADAARQGGRRPPPVPAARPLLRSTRVLHGCPPRPDHRLRGEHRPARPEPPRGPAALHLQRPAGLREGVRGGHGQGRRWLAAQAAHLSMVARSRAEGLPAQAGPAAGADGRAGPLRARGEAGVRRSSTRRSAGGCASPSPAVPLSRRRSPSSSTAPASSCSRGTASPRPVRR